MEDLRLSAVAARVVAWHNRHPLARRIGVSHVHAMGYVALPFAGPAGAAPAATPLPSSAAEPAAPDGASLRERALARARQQEAAPVLTETIAAPAAGLGLASLEPDFSEAFIETLRARQVARFATKAGVAMLVAPGDGPVRQVRADGGHAGRAAVPVYLLTAVIETGTRKSRVLLGGGLQAPVLGRRIHSTPRLAALATLLLGLVAAPVWVLRGGSPATVPPVVAVAPPVTTSHSAAPSAIAAPGPVPSVVPPIEAAASAASPTPVHEPPTIVAAHEQAIPTPAGNAAGPPGHDKPPPAVAATAVAATAVAARPASAPPRAHPKPHPGPLQLGAPSIRPAISEDAKAAARAWRQAMAASRGQSAAAPAPAPAGAHAVVAAAPPPMAPATVSTAAPSPGRGPAAAPEATPPPAAGPATAPPVAAPTPAPLPVPSAFALSTRPLRTRAEADQVSVAMRALLKTVGATEVKVDVLPQGDDWRVVGMPFARRADADKARALLVSRGMRIEVVGF